MGLGPSLSRVKPSGKAGQFSGKHTFFLAISGQPVPDVECFAAGDLLAVSKKMDAEAGDLVVWGTPSDGDFALARVTDDYTFVAVAGFPSPSGQVFGESIQGVVVGRLRHLES